MQASRATPRWSAFSSALLARLSSMAGIFPWPRFSTLAHAISVDPPLSTKRMPLAEHIPVIWPVIWRAILEWD
jgi:hypothetical protein